MKHLRTFQTGNIMLHSGITYAHPNVITAGSADRIEKLADYLENPQIIQSPRKLVTAYGTYKGHKIMGFTTGMGPSSVSITLPEAIEAYYTADDAPSVDMLILRIGTSGGLQPFLKKGDMVSTIGAERAESVSDKIMGSGYVAVASPEAVNVLYAAAEKMKVGKQSVYSGVNITTDELYEYNAWIAENGPHRAHTLSMEASVHFAERDFYNKLLKKNIKAGELLVISDNPMNPSEGHGYADASGNALSPEETKVMEQKVEEAHILAGLEAVVLFRNQN